MKPFFFKKAMYALNRIEIIGYLTQNIELRTTPDGTSVADVNLRVPSRFLKDDGTWQEATTFVDVTFWRNSAEILAQYTREGSQIFITGRLRTDSWEDENGKKKYRTRITAEDFILLTPRESSPALPEGGNIARGLNSASLIGNLTYDVELRQTPSGQTVGNISVATNRKWKDKRGEEREETEFHNVVIWGDLVKNAENFLKKGKKVFIAGRMQTRSWDTPEGEKRYTTEVVATELIPLGHNAPENSSIVYSSREESAPKKAAAPMEDIPTIKYESDIKPEDLPF